MTEIIQPPNYYQKYGKKYYEEHREELMQKVKPYIQKYRENNREKVNSDNREKIECKTCGTYLNRNNYARHKKSIKHQQNAINSN